MEQNLGNKGFTLAVFGGDMVSVAFELRYMIIFSIMLIFADLWWGHSDTMKRYAIAEKANDIRGMEKYKWHKSRAIRRTVSKFIDYSTYWLIGAFMGMAITEPLGWGGHFYTAAFILMLGCLAEIASIAGHIFYVKYNIEVKVIDVVKWIWRFIIGIFKMKGQQIGEALEEASRKDKEE